MRPPELEALAIRCWGFIDILGERAGTASGTSAGPAAGGARSAAPARASAGSASGAPYSSMSAKALKPLSEASCCTAASLEMMAIRLPNWRA